MALADQRWDVLVVGAGPSGGAAAIALGRAGLRVLLLERSHHQGFRAGETIRAECREALLDLGVWERLREGGSIASQGVLSAWGEASLRERHAILDPRGTAFHVDRNRLDALLASEAEARGAVVLRGAAARALERAPGGFRAEVASASGTRKVAARFVIDATGRRAWVGKRAGARRAVFDRLAGVSAILGPYDTAADPTLLLEAVEDGYWYSVPLPGDKLLACFLCDADRGGGGRLADVFRAALARAPHTNARTSGGLAIEGRLHVRAAESALLEPSAGPGWIAIGDAARSHDPLAGIGVREALADGIEAAALAVAALGGDDEGLLLRAAKVREGFFRYLWGRRAYYRLEERWPKAPFWARRRELLRAPLPSLSGYST